MQLNPAEISELIKSRIQGLSSEADIRNQGTVVSVTDGIVRVHGLSDVMQGEMLEFPATAAGVATFGLALNLERDSVGAVILGEYEHISEGDTVKCTGRILEVPVGSLLSLGMESLQLFLPARVPSNVDWGLNSAGTLAGAGAAWTLERFGFLDRWSRFRANWFAPDAQGSLVLLALWPIALLFPAPVPMGLGQVLERAEDALALMLQETPWLDWLPVREVELQPLLPVYEVLCVSLGQLLPCLLAFSLIRHLHQKAVAWLILTVCGLLFTALSAALTYGPAHAWGWLNEPVQLALAIAAVAAWPMMWRTEKTLQVLALVGLVLQLTLLNNASANAYFSLTLQNWEQGQFIRFHGLIQWLGWLWPFALLVYLMRCLSAARPTKMQA